MESESHLHENFGRVLHLALGGFAIGAMEYDKQRAFGARIEKRLKSSEGWCAKREIRIYMRLVACEKKIPGILLLCAGATPMLTELGDQVIHERGGMGTLRDSRYPM